MEEQQKKTDQNERQVQFNNSMSGDIGQKETLVRVKGKCRGACARDRKR